MRYNIIVARMASAALPVRRLFQLHASPAEHDGHRVFLGEQQPLTACTFHQRLRAAKKSF
jgi:hypothetical protein